MCLTGYHSIHVPTTSSSTFLAESTSTEFAAQKSGTTGTNDFATIIALIHFVTGSAVKSIASIADPYFVVGLEFMAPVTMLTDISLAFVTSHLYVRG